MSLVIPVIERQAPPPPFIVPAGLDATDQLLKRWGTGSRDRRGGSLHPLERLRMRLFAGDVLWFVCQPQLILEGGVIYRADFVVQPRIGPCEWVDTKGYQTQDSKNKLKQVKDRYGIDVTLVRKN